MKVPEISLVRDIFVENPHNPITHSRLSHREAFLMPELIKALGAINSTLRRIAIRLEEISNNTNKEQN